MSAAFGVSGAAQAGYRLEVRDTRTATLFEIMADGTSREASVASCWSVLAAGVEQDWNSRLVAKGQAPGVMPTDTGDVFLHRQFGRELDVLFMVAASYQEGRQMLPLWIEAEPEWRLDLWKDLCGYRIDVDRFPQSAQDLQEQLLQRAPDGSIDEARQGRLFAHRKRFNDAIRAERRDKPGWRSPKVHWR